MTDDSPRNEGDQTKIGRYLIDKIIHEDDLTQKWIEFLIAVEAGLGVAFGFLARPGQGTPAQEGIPPLVLHGALCLIAFLGILAALFLTKLAVEDQQWQGWYVAQFNALPGFKGRVFPEDRGKLGVSPKGQPYGSFSRTIIWLGATIGGAWLVVLILSFSLLFSSNCSLRL